MVSIDQIREIKTQKEGDWIRLEDVVGVDIGKKFVNGSRTPVTAIRVLVAKKVEADKLDEKLAIPRGILVDEAFDGEKLFSFSLPNDLNNLEAGDLEGVFIAEKISLSDQVKLDVIPQSDLTPEEWLIVEDGGLAYGIKRPNQELLYADNAAQAQNLYHYDVYPVIRTDVLERVFVDRPRTRKAERERRFKDLDNDGLRPGLPVRGGTIGAVVEHEGEPYVLTCQHIFGNWQQLQEKGRRQATPTDSRYESLKALIKKAKIHKLPLSSADGSRRDYMLVELRDGGNRTIQVEPEIAGIGPIFGTAEAVRGLRVRKFGAATELTHGIIDTVDLTVKLKNGAVLKNQIGIVADLVQSDQFCDGGDSGAVIVNDAQEAVGLFVAYSDGGRYAVATKIQEVVENLDIEAFVTGGDGELDSIIDESVREALAVGSLITLGPSAIRVLQFDCGCDGCPPPGGGG